MSSLRYTAVTYEIKKESIERITVNQRSLIWPIFPFEWEKNVIHFMRKMLKNHLRGKEGKNTRIPSDDLLTARIDGSVGWPNCPVPRGRDHCVPPEGPSQPPPPPPGVGSSFRQAQKNIAPWRSINLFSSWELKQTQHFSGFWETAFGSKSLMVCSFWKPTFVGFVFLQPPVWHRLRILARGS